MHTKETTVGTKIKKKKRHSESIEKDTHTAKRKKKSKDESHLKDDAENGTNKANKKDGHLHQATAKIPNEGTSESVKKQKCAKDDGSKTAVDKTMQRKDKISLELPKLKDAIEDPAKKNKTHIESIVKEKHTAKRKKKSNDEADLKGDAENSTSKKKDGYLHEATANIPNKGTSELVKKQKCAEDVDTKTAVDKTTQHKNEISPELPKSEGAVEGEAKAKKRKFKNKKSKKDKNNALETFLVAHEDDTEVAGLASNNIEDADTEDTASLAKEVKKPPKKKKDKTKNVTGIEDVDDFKPSTKDLAISYLKTWKKSRGKWSFKKSRQIWLIKNLYNPDNVNDKYFSYLLEYLEESKGCVRTRLLENAQTIYDTAENTDDSTDVTKHNRARRLMQMLSE